MKPSMLFSTFTPVPPTYAPHPPSSLQAPTDCCINTGAWLIGLAKPKAKIIWLDFKMLKVLCWCILKHGRCFHERNVNDVITDAANRIVFHHTWWFTLIGCNTPHEIICYSVDGDLFFYVVPGIDNGSLVYRVNLPFTWGHAGCASVPLWRWARRETCGVEGENLQKMTHAAFYQTSRCHCWLTTVLL